MLRAFVLPTAVRRVAQIDAAGGHPLPFSNGGAGRTNGVGALKYQFDLLERDHYDATIGTVSIPMLGSRGLRSSLLCDGCYAPPGEARFATRDTAGDRAPHRDALAAIVAFFTVPIMGVKPERAERSIPEAERVMAFLASAPPPAFPGAIDVALAGRGRILFDARCASCHGRYADGPPPCQPLSFPNRLVPQAEMNTDAARWQAIDAPLAARLERGTFGRHVDVAGTGGYVAAILSGLWATARTFTTARCRPCGTSCTRRSGRCDSSWAGTRSITSGSGSPGRPAPTACTDIPPALHRGARPRSTTRVRPDSRTGGTSASSKR